MMTTVFPDMFPGDPIRAAAAIYDVVASHLPMHGEFAILEHFLGLHSFVGCAVRTVFRPR
jgi:hypothetical protein